MNRIQPNRKPALLLLLLCLCPATVGRAGSAAESQVPPCSHITLSASYLAELKPGAGSTFHFRLTNGTDRAIALAQPVPTSAHWFTRDGEHWYWRASVGAGGSPVDAMAPNGRMFVFRATKRVDPGQILRIPAHGTAEWEQGAKDNPALEFKPSCKICDHPQDREFRGIFAYAYQPMPQDHSLGLLACGIRSSPVDMPPVR